MSLQLDMFNTKETDYLYLELQKVKLSNHRQCGALFSLVAELQNQLIELKKTLNNLEEPKE